MTSLPPSMLDTIVCGDNAKLLKRLPAACIDLTVTSPPYDNLRTYDGYTWDFEAVAAELWRVTKPGGVVVWVVGDGTEDGSETGTSFRQALYFMSLGFRLHDTMIYEKAGFPFPDSTRYNPVFEYMFILSKGRPAIINLIADRENTYQGDLVARKNGDRQKDGSIIPNSAWRNGSKRRVKETGIRNNIWRYSIGGGNITEDRFIRKHPAAFPEALAHDHILSWSNPGMVVLDPFSGSGTTAKMAVSTGRHFIGIDISEKYNHIARRRVAEQREKMVDTWERGKGIPGQPVDTAALPLWAGVK